MTRRTTLILGIFAGLVVALCWIWWPTAREHARTVKDSYTEGLTRHSEEAAPSSATPTRPEERQVEREERRRTMAQTIERTNVPISFWGKVLDQDQKPIAGAIVQYTYSTEHGNIAGTAWGEQKIHKGEVTTDLAGLFALDGIKGHTLTIESLTKEGYAYKAREARVYNYYGDISSGKFVPVAAKPIIFVMVNKTTAEPLVSYGGSFGKTIHLPGNGTPVRWSVWKGQLDPSGELQVTFKREPSEVAKIGETVTWSARVAIVGGGIAEASPDELVYRAPSDGFVAEIDYPRVEQKRGIPARSFYIRTADGRYGRIDLTLYADDEGPTARCLIKAVMNPFGSQNLEPGSG